MTGKSNYESAEITLEKHLALIDSYKNASHSTFASFQEEFLMVSDLDPYELGKKTRDELFDAAYLLYAYSAYLQDEVNINRVIVNWCNNQLDLLVAKHRNDYGFDKFTKYESKRPIVISENSYAEAVEGLRLVADARLQVLDGKVYELKRQADTLLEKGKRQ